MLLSSPEMIIKNSGLFTCR